MSYQAALQAQSGSDDMKDLFIKPLVSGTVAGLGTKFLFSDIGNGAVRVFGMNVPVPVLLGGAVAIGSVVSELMRQKVFTSFKEGEAVSFALAGGLNAGAAIGTVGLVDKLALSQIGYGRLAGLGFASEIIGDMAYHRVLKSLF